ncbi:hypothetical protein BGZ83_005098 [Gryganskiella cystojenkinii]|nr:hypothetical protein BGZ83_005098 [Gryganskiella cystojenkinii]
MVVDPIAKILQQIISPLARPLPGYSFASKSVNNIPPFTPACDQCVSKNVESLPECLNVVFPAEFKSLSDVTEPQRECFCAWSKTPSSSWSQGCVSDTLCSQDFVNKMGDALTSTMRPWACASIYSNVVFSAAIASPSGSEKARGAAVAAAIVLGAAVVAF